MSSSGGIKGPGAAGRWTLATWQERAAYHGKALGRLWKQVARSLGGRGAKETGQERFEAWRMECVSLRKPGIRRLSIRTRQNPS